MERTPDEQLAAIIQIRDYAAAYEGKRKEFYTDLLAMLTTPIRDDADYLANVKRMYLAAIGALTAEIQPPTTTTYDAVLKYLNSALDEGTLGPVHLTVVPDDTREDYAIPGGQRATFSSGLEAAELHGALPKPRRLTKVQQALVDRFRAELPKSPRPFAARGAERA